MFLPIVAFDVPAPGVGRVTLTRPERLNAYDGPMCRALVDALHRYAEDDALRALVLTGSGRAFCAGGDIRRPDQGAAAQRPLGWARELAEELHAVNRALWRLDKPTIAAVNGVAVAGGLVLALLCDFRIAGRSARLGDTSGAVGLLPDEGGAWLFPRVMGFDRALRMVLCSEVYDAETALRLGLVTEVVDDADLERRSVEFAGDLAGRAPLAVRLTKRMMRRALEGTFEHSLGDAELAATLANDSRDAAEGVAAFREKRPPRFTGR